MWYLIIENRYGSFIVDEGQYSKIAGLYRENVESAKTNPAIFNVRMVRRYE